MLNFKSKDCYNLPNKWKNRISSIFTNKCIILYTQLDCRSEKLKATLIKNKVYFNDNLNHPANLHSYSFYGSWYEKNFNSTELIKFL